MLNPDSSPELSAHVRSISDTEAACSARVDGAVGAVGAGWSVVAELAFEYGEFPARLNACTRYQ